MRGKEAIRPKRNSFEMSREGNLIATPNKIIFYDDELNTLFENY